MTMTDGDLITRATEKAVHAFDLTRRYVPGENYGHALGFAIRAALEELFAHRILIPRTPWTVQRPLVPGVYLFKGAYRNRFDQERKVERQLTVSDSLGKLTIVADDGDGFHRALPVTRFDGEWRGPQQYGQWEDL